MTPRKLRKLYVFSFWAGWMLTFEAAYLAWGLVGWLLAVGIPMLAIGIVGGFVYRRSSDD